MAKKSALAGDNDGGIEVLKGTSITRTTIPVLPANHLSRRALVANFKAPVPGTTLVSAPAGYGKTSFVTEVVMNQPLKVIWYNISENRDRQDFNRHLVQAIRNVVPNFAPWFTADNKDYARDLVLKVCNELGQINEKFIMVVDNSRIYEEKDDRFANYLFEILPKNLHIIGIRRATPVHTYSRFSGDSNFAIYGPVDLKFTQSEVLSALEIHGLDPNDESIIAIADLAKGWPAAVQMIAHNLTRGRTMDDLERIMASEHESLSWLVSQVLSSLTTYERETLASLSAVKSFNYEIAEVILGNGFKKNELNGFALDGLFFEQTNNPERTFTFNTLMGESLLNELHKNPEREKTINSRLSHFFEKNNQHLLAVEHAQKAGEFERVQLLIQEAARVLASRGEGQELIRWSKFVGDESNLGLRLRQTLVVMGLTVDFKYDEAMSLIDEMRFGSKGLPIEDFISKFTNLTEAYVAFAYFRRKDFDRIFKALAEPVISFDISLNERLAAKRLQASIAFLLDDYEELLKVRRDAFELGASDINSYLKFHLDAIDAMKLYGDGQYQNAYETSTSALSLAKREGFVGITGFVDIMYVQALCLIEFGQVDDALQVLSSVQEIAESWSLGPFYFQAVSRITRTLAARGEITEALEMLRGSREYAASFKVSHEFDLFNDLTELSIRAKVGDWDRVRILLERAPDFLLSRQLKIAMEEANSGFRPIEVLERLPEDNPRQIIEKNLALARFYIAQESIALTYVRKALDSGAQVQAVETFLRLDISLLNLILKAVNEKPTVYLENLATSIQTRIRTLSKPTQGLSAPLTKREIEVLRHLSTGNPISAIAGTLHVSQNTMKTHLKNIYRKFEVDGRESAVTKAKALFIL